MSALSVTGPAERPSSVTFAVSANATLPEDQIRPLVRDLHKVKPLTYWTDLLASSISGWLCFVISVFVPLPFWGTALAVLGATACLYRSLCFVHELSHQTARTLPGFEMAYNFLVGFPLLMPSFVYVGVHQSHHRVDIYGTDADPEYLPFSRSALITTVFALESVLIPVILLLRFLVLAPAGLVSPALHRWLTTHLSSLTMNPKYRREGTPTLLSKIGRGSLAIILLWSAPIALSLLGLLSWRWFFVWLAIDCTISLVNSLRTLGAHAYESNGEPMDREAQLHDSIDTPGAFWTELWAPVGLRYHALHHYFPGIPYHNLPEAYRRIVGCFSVAENYRQMSSPSLPSSLHELLKRGWGKS